ncbi:putative transcription factor Tesmin family [Rosa chinensis]|uniref:Putative transcription factor Tesmin family n=1 Tax=Rosa chinensis TaxID=74649 RepID=A0A2P6RWF0_ROSCH|nr:CRC domain-containing protein TSO1 [Rosa chinensis]PRQ50754.1 putative transcription factor Tesmin family [Rosa chinensis]
MDGSPETNRVAAAAASSPAQASSPAVQESPFSNFLSNLTPINTVKSDSYSQRLVGTFFPTPPVVFTSPHIDLERETSFLERNDIVEAGYKECNTTIFQNPSFEKEVQLCSASGCIDEYLADPAKVDCTGSADIQSSINAGKESNTEVHEVIDGSTKSEPLPTLNQAEVGLPLPSLTQIETTIIEKIDKNSVDLVTRAQSRGQNTAKEVSQHHRGIRRHLQFETAVAQKSSNFGNHRSLCSLTHDTDNLRSQSKLTNLKTLASSHLDSKAFSSLQGVSCDTSQLSSCLCESVRSSQIGGNSSTSAPIRSGIGLHLNSITRSTSMSSDVLLSRKATGCLSTPDQMLEHDNRNNIEHESSSSFISVVLGQNYSSVGNDQQESQTAAHTTFTFYSTDGVPYLPCDSMHQILVDQHSVPCEEMNASQDANKIEELNELSQKRKRRRGAEISEGCKRCNCKKSKCLKLYCECFAAGVFCLDSCACENCYNKPEFEDTVFDARQQIESRNPLAFAPKVVKHEINSLPNIMEEADWTTPSSARHKRGCNCKKSKCLKKYCECFQANVGCSGACRCDCCQNPCGTKADHEYNRAEKWETHPAEKLDTIKGGNDCIKASDMDPYSPWEGLSVISNLTPLSNPCSSTRVSSASSSMRNRTKISQAQLQSSRLQPSGTGHLKRGRSPVIFTPQVFESKGPSQLSSDGASYERMDDDIPELLKEPSIPPKVVKGSPNQKRVSPPQSRAEKLRSRSPKGLRSGRKFILQAMPSFPPLSPYSDSKAINDTRNDHKGTQNN